MKRINYPDIPLSNEDIYIITKETDRLDNIAYQYYGDNELWKILSVYNGNINSLFPPIGIQLRIPQPIEKILEKIEKFNK